MGKKVAKVAAWGTAPFWGGVSMIDSAIKGKDPIKGLDEDVEDVGDSVSLPEPPAPPETVMPSAPAIAGSEGVRRAGETSLAKRRMLGRSYLTKGQQRASLGASTLGKQQTLGA